MCVLVLAEMLKVAGWPVTIGSGDITTPWTFTWYSSLLSATKHILNQIKILGFSPNLTGGIIIKDIDFEPKLRFKHQTHLKNIIKPQRSTNPESTLKTMTLSIKPNSRTSNYNDPGSKVIDFVKTRSKTL